MNLLKRIFIRRRLRRKWRKFIVSNNLNLKQFPNPGYRHALLLNNQFLQDDPKKRSYIADIGFQWTRTQTSSIND